MDKTYITDNGTISWFSPACDDYRSNIKPNCKKLKLRCGFRIKLGTYTPFPFWHKFVAMPVQFNYSYTRSLIVQRMLIRGAFSRKYDRPRKRLGKRIKLF